MKRLILLCMFLCTGAAAIAQSSDKFTGSLLWKISGNGLKTPSYILGTHHLYALDFFDEIPGARAALEASSQVVGELLMSDQGELASRMQSAAMLPEGVAYNTLLSESDYAKLDEGLRGLMGVGLEQFGMFKPGMISAMLSMVVFAQANPGFNAQEHVAIDVYVQNYAAENGRPVIGLETVEDQLYALFDAEPLKYQAEQLVCSIGSLDYGVASLKKLGEYYAAGNLAAMYDLAFNSPDDPCPSSEAYQSILAKDRNDKWLAQLPGIMSGGTSFIAVGALHIGGEEGLLFQLDKMGYKVEAVK